MCVTLTQRVEGNLDNIHTFLFNIFSEISNILILILQSMLNLCKWNKFLISGLVTYCFRFKILGESHGWRSVVGCSPWGRERSDTTERLHFHFSLSCIGEGNGNPLQCSCLENPRDGGAWWASVYGVAQIRTGLKRLSNSSSSSKREENKNCCKNIMLLKSLN